jgi:modulator of FtsH protease HflK
MITGLLMSINDPRWGNNDQGDGKRGSDQGPPDLEQIWRDFNNRLGNLFGRGGKGGGAIPPGPSRRWGGGAVAAVVGVVLLLWAGSGFYTVDASQRGVVLRFGKFQEVTRGGLQWHIPYPVETVELVDVSHVRTAEVGFNSVDHSKDLHESLMLTDDENIISIQFAVQYTLGDPAEYLFTNTDPDAMVKMVAESAMREIVGKSKMDFVLYEGREAIAKEAQLLMQQILNDYRVGDAKGSGILISRVTMQNAQPPEQVQDAFNDATKAVQDRERLKNDGQAYFNDVVPKAEGTAARYHEEALGYAGRVVAQAEGDASRFKQVYAEYAKAPEVTRNRMYIDTMQQIFSNASKVLVDAKSSGNMLYLPLDKMLQQSGGATSTADTAVSVPKPTASDSPAPVVPKQDVDGRVRGSLGRDRGER